LHTNITHNSPYRQSLGRVLFYTDFHFHTHSCHTPVIALLALPAFPAYAIVPQL